MTKFNQKDRVCSVGSNIDKNNIGTVLAVDRVGTTLVEFDEPIEDGHDGDGRGI